VQSFSYVFLSNAEGVDATAHLYRSDDQPLAALSAGGADSRVRSVSTEEIEHRKVDAARYAYFVYFKLSASAGPALVPISASVAYRLP
jgi:hypothetical protein